MMLSRSMVHEQYKLTYNNKTIKNNNLNYDNNHELILSLISILIDHHSSLKFFIIYIITPVDVINYFHKMHPNLERFYCIQFKSFLCLFVNKQSLNFHNSFGSHSQRELMPIGYFERYISKTFSQYGLIRQRNRDAIFLISSLVFHRSSNCYLVSYEHFSFTISYVKCFYFYKKRTLLILINSQAFLNFLFLICVRMSLCRSNSIHFVISTNKVIT